MKGLTALFFIACLGFYAPGQDMDDLLEMNLEQLLDINVVTGKSTTNLSDSPAIISVITREEMINLGAENLADLLNLIPGFEVNRAVMFGTHHTVGVRGRLTDFGEDVLILLDGQRMNEVYTGSGLQRLKFMRVADLERVELIRGPGSTLYGSNAFVGIVHIITRSGVDVAEKPEVHLEIGNMNTRRGSVRYGRLGADYHWSLSADFGSDDGDTYGMDRGYLRPPVALPEFQDPVEEAYDLSFRLNAGQLALKIDHFNRRLDGFMPWGFLDNAWESPILDTNQDDARTTRLSATYEWNMGSWQIKPAVRYFEGKIRQLYFLAAPGVPPFSQGTSVAEVGWVGSPNHDTRGTEYELQFNRKAGKHDLVGGVLYGEEELTGVWNRFNFFPFPTGLERVDYGEETHWFDGAESYADPATRTIGAVYLQDTWRAHEKLGVTAGIRYDDYNDFGDSLNPRLGLVYKPKDGWICKMLYGRAFRAPTFNELVVRNNPVQRGNSSLEAQTIQTLELYLYHSFSSRLGASLSAYRNTYQDLIQLVDAQPLPTFFNGEGEEEDTGFEVEMKYKRDRYKYVFLNYAYIKPTDAQGNTRPYIARNKVSLVANYDPFSWLVVSLNGYYRGSRTNPTLDPGHDLDDHWVWGANLRMPELGENMEVALSFKNLSDTQYDSPGFSYVLTPDNVPHRGLQATARLTYTF